MSMGGFGGRVGNICAASIHPKSLSIFKLSSSPRPSLYSPIMRYSHVDHHDERAPSTAEEFKRVAEERLKEAEQGVASQTIDKAFDGAEEAVVGGHGSDRESVKNRFEEHGDSRNADFRRTGEEDEEGEGPTNTVREDQWMNVSDRFV